jgi:hypothetical protein
MLLATKNPSVLYDKNIPVQIKYKKKNKDSLVGKLITS